MLLKGSSQRQLCTGLNDLDQLQVLWDLLLEPATGNEVMIEVNLPSRTRFGRRSRFRRHDLGSVSATSTMNPFIQATEKRYSLKSDCCK
jgi:hypothetical protein